MIISQHNKKGQIRKPFILYKDNTCINHSEGKWKIWIYSHQVIEKNERKFRYREIRYAGAPARFQTSDDAKQFALYLTGQ